MVGKSCSFAASPHLSLNLRKALCTKALEHGRDVQNPSQIPPLFPPVCKNVTGDSRSDDGRDHGSDDGRDHGRDEIS